MTKDQQINELISIKAMAEMLVEKTDKLIEKLTEGSTPVIPKNKNKNKMKKEVERFLIKRKETRIKRGMRINAEKVMPKSKKN